MASDPRTFDERLAQLKPWTRPRAVQWRDGVSDSVEAAIALFKRGDVEQADRALLRAELRAGFISLADYRQQTSIVPARESASGAPRMVISHTMSEGTTATGIPQSERGVLLAMVRGHFEPVDRWKSDCDRWVVAESKNFSPLWSRPGSSSLLRSIEMARDELEKAGYDVEIKTIELTPISDRELRSNVADDDGSTIEDRLFRARYQWHGYASVVPKPTHDPNGVTAREREFFRDNVVYWEERLAIAAVNGYDAVAWGPEDFTDSNGNLVNGIYVHLKDRFLSRDRWTASPVTRVDNSAVYFNDVPVPYDLVLALKDATGEVNDKPVGTKRFEDLIKTHRIAVIQHAQLTIERTGLIADDFGLSMG